MLAGERLLKIHNSIMKNKSVKIEELAQLYSVTPMTIRRDLDKLTEMYPNVKRCHGGALLSEEIDWEERFENKQTMNRDDKIAIAKVAFNLIHDNDTIYLDAGTTTLELAKIIIESNLKLKVVTNDIEIARVLRNSQCEILLTSGVLQKSTGCLVGNLAEEFLRKIKFKTAFLGCTAINDEFEVLTPSIEKRTMKSLVLRNSNRSYLLTDHTKFSRNSTYVIYHLSDFSGVITTKRFEPDQKKRIELVGINLISV